MNINISIVIDLCQVMYQAIVNGNVKFELFNEDGLGHNCAFMCASSTAPFRFIYPTDFLSSNVSPLT